MVQDVSLTHMLHHSQLAFSATGKMPVPQENIFFVEQASYLLLTMVQHLSLTDLTNEC
jgi:hypothetical protein